MSRAARTLKRAVQSALNASAINVMDLEAQALPVARFETGRSDYSGGIAIRTTPGDSQSIDIVFLDDRGADLHVDDGWGGVFAFGGVKGQRGVGDVSETNQRLAGDEVVVGRASGVDLRAGDRVAAGRAVGPELEGGVAGGWLPCGVLREAG